MRRDDESHSHSGRLLAGDNDNNLRLSSRRGRSLHSLAVAAANYIGGARIRLDTFRQCPRCCRRRGRRLLRQNSRVYSSTSVPGTTGTDLQMQFNCLSLPVL